MYACAVSNNVYITGSGKGKIYNWNSTTAGKGIDAHQGKVQTIIVKGEKVYTGGDDGDIFIWKRASNGEIKIKQSFVNSRDLLKDLKSLKLFSEE
jgi:hypothetical protein